MSRRPRRPEPAWCDCRECKALDRRHPQEGVQLALSFGGKRLMSPGVDRTALRRALLPQLMEAQGNRCCYCGVRFWAYAPFGSWDLSWTMPTLEHFVPVSQGGSNSWANLVAACQRCNTKRGHEDALAFFARRGWLSANQRKKHGRRFDQLIRNAEPRRKRARTF